MSVLYSFGNITRYIYLLMCKYSSSNHGKLPHCSCTHLARELTNGLGRTRKRFMYAGRTTVQKKTLKNLPTSAPDWVEFVDEISLLFSIKINAIPPEVSRRSRSILSRTREQTMTNRGISRLVSAKSRGSLETVIEKEEEWWLTERTWLERTDERRNDRLFLTRKVRSTVCARERDGECPKLTGVNELGHVRSRPGPLPRLYPLYRGLVFPMGPRLISWLCESDATRPRVDNVERDGFLEQFLQHFSILYD